MIHILCTQNWAAGCNPPLRSRKHTERIFVYKLYGFWFGYFINTALLVGLYKCINDKNGGRTSLLLTSQRMPAATMRTHAYTILKTKNRRYYSAIFLFLDFIIFRVLSEVFHKCSIFKYKWSCSLLVVFDVVFFHEVVRKFGAIVQYECLVWFIKG